MKFQIFYLVFPVDVVYKIIYIKMCIHMNFNISSHMKYFIYVQNNIIYFIIDVKFYGNICVLLSAQIPLLNLESR